MMEIPAELASPALAAAAATLPGPGGPLTGEVAPGVQVSETRGFLMMFVELPEFGVKDLGLNAEGPAKAVRTADF